VSSGEARLLAFLSLRPGVTDRRTIAGSLWPDVDEARAAGAGRAWLFSRRSGPFWQKLGFALADRDELAAALPDAHQVVLFAQSGQLDREVAWSRAL
jgi:N-acetylglutamate synthase-like GNAT family acetyltransferase